MGANAQTSVTLFVANAILTAAQQNFSAATGVPVFATTVTRDAAFGGSNKVLAEGQLCYLESTDVVQYYTGAAWATVGPSLTSGLIAMVPTSVAVGSGTGTANAVGQVTYSLASSVSLNGVFTSAYRNYKIVGEFLASTSSDLYLRLRAAGTDNSTANSYVQQELVVTNAAASASDTTGDKTEIVPNNNTTLINSISFEFFNPQIAAATAIMGAGLSNTNGGYYAMSGISHNQSVSYDGFTIIQGSGTITGTISVYGFNQ